MSNDNENSAVFSSRQNGCNGDAAQIEDGKPFQARAAATGKAPSRSNLNTIKTRGSADADKPTRRVYVLVEVNKHGPILGPLQLFATTIWNGTMRDSISANISPSF